MSPMRRLLLVLLPATAAAAQFRALQDPDLWWHLRGGAMVAAARSPWVDDFGSFLQGGTWHNAEWLFELLLHWGWSALGPAAAIGFIAVAAATAAWLSLRHAHDAELPLVVLGQLAIVDHWAPRPQSWMLVGLCLLTAMRDARVGAWIALGVVWAQLHASHVLIPAVAGAHLLEAIVHRGNLRPRLQVFVATVVVSLCLSPLGPGVLTEVLDHAATDSARHIGDMRPPALADLLPDSLPDVAGWALWASAALALWRLEWRARRAIADACLFALGTALALTAVRFIAPAALLVVPLACRVAGPGGARLGVVLLPLLLLAARDRPGAPWGGWGVRSLHLPEDVATVLEEQSGTLWNHYDDGGFLSWRLPRWQIAIDGRTPTFFSGFTHALARQSTSSTATFSTLAIRHDIDAALVPRRLPLCAGLRGLEGWRAAYADLERVLFVPTDSAIAGHIVALPLCDGDAEPACPALEAYAEIAAIEARSPGALYADAARVRLHGCGADPLALVEPALRVLADDPGPDRMAALTVLVRAGRREEALAEADEALSRFDEPDWAMLAVQASGGDIVYWDQAARRYDDAMPLRVRLAYARALAGAGRTAEAAAQAERAAWGGQVGAAEFVAELAER